MEEDSLKYEITSDLIDEIIRKATLQRDADRIELIKGEVYSLQSKKGMVYYLKPLLYAVLVAIIIFSVLTFTKALNRKGIKSSIMIGTLKERLV